MTCVLPSRQRCLSRYSSRPPGRWLAEGAPHNEQVAQPHAVLVGNADTRMGAAARDRRTAPARWQSAILHINRVAHLRDAPAGPRARG